MSEASNVLAENDKSNDSDTSQSTVSHFNNDYETMIKSPNVCEFEYVTKINTQNDVPKHDFTKMFMIPKGCNYSLLAAKINAQKVARKSEYSHWTNELIGVAKRLFELNFPADFIAYITDMSVRSVRRLKKQLKPSDSSGEWKCSIETKKRGPPKKDKTALHKTISEIKSIDPKLSQKMIVDRLPEGLRIGQSQLSREIKAIKKSKIIESIKRKRKSKQKSSAES